MRKETKCIIFDPVSSRLSSLGRPSVPALSKADGNVFTGKWRDGVIHSFEGSTENSSRYDVNSGGRKSHIKLPMRASLQIKDSKSDERYLIAGDDIRKKG